MVTDCDNLEKILLLVGGRSSDYAKLVDQSNLGNKCNETLCNNN